MTIEASRASAAAVRPPAAACRLCGSGDTRPVYRLDFAAVRRCRACDVAYLDPAPTAETLAALYNDPAYHGDDHPNYWSNCQKGYSEDGAAVRQFKALLDRIPPVPGGRLLDVGCATGVFLDMARKRGWGVQGVELSAWASGYAREAFGLSVHTGDLDGAAFPDASFDVVTAWDVFEHLPDPAAFLREVRRVLKPGGALFIETVNDRSLVNLAGYLIFVLTAGRAVWPLRRLYVPYHLYYFSRKSLDRALRNGGFARTEYRMTEFPIERIDGMSRPVRWAMRAIYFFQRITGRTTVITALSR